MNVLTPSLGKQYSVNIVRKSWQTHKEKSLTTYFPHGMPDKSCRAPQPKQDPELCGSYVDATRDQWLFSSETVTMYKAQESLTTPAYIRGDSPSGTRHA